MANHYSKTWSLLKFQAPSKWVLLGIFGLINHLPSAALAQAPDFVVHKTELRYKESLEDALKRLKINDLQFNQCLSNCPEAVKLTRLPPKTPIVISTSSPARIEQLKVYLPQMVGDKQNVSLDAVALLMVRPQDQPKQIKFIKITEPVEIRKIRKYASFDGNFFNVMDRQEIPDAISDQFIRAFSSKVNFARELNHQANFEMIYEQGFINGNSVSLGKLLEAHINLNRKSFDAYLWTNTEGKTSYYSATGEALNAFNLKSPLAFLRKTSNFGIRIDPFNRQWANHQGIDLGAAPGTEVFATANGKVKFAGKQGAYGNLIILEHANGYETYYGHLSNFSKNIEVNQNIKQGSVIAYVGSTGRATAPHLHYELRKLSIPIDPEQSFQSEGQTKLQGQELAAFEKSIRGNYPQQIVKISNQLR